MAAAAGSASEQPAAAGRRGALRPAMLRRGYVPLRGALPPTVVAPLVAQLSVIEGRHQPLSLAAAAMVRG